MIKDLKEYVLFDTTKYLSDIEQIVPSTPSFVYQQNLGYILSSVFVQITGCIEHKLDKLVLQLCIDNEKYRQRKMRESSRIPSGSKQCNTILNDIHKSICYDKSEYKTWKDYDEFDAVLRSVSEIAKKTRLNDYLVHYNTLSTIIEFQNLLLEFSNNFNLIKKLEWFFEKSFNHIWLPKHSIEELKNVICQYFKENNLPSDQKTKLTEIKKYIESVPHVLDFFELEKLYDRAIAFRNDFAHNENSVYVNTYTPLELCIDDIILSDWIFRFVSVFYVDALIRKKFCEYMIKINRQQLK